MSIDRDNLFNLLNSLEYPQIRQFCLVNKNYNQVCQNNLPLINSKLSQYVEKILNSMQEQNGFVDWDRPSVRHSDKPNLYDYDNNEQPFVYKYLQLNSLIPNHTFELYDDYDPVWKTFNYGQLNENYAERFKLQETIDLPTSNINYALQPFLTYTPEIPKTVVGTANSSVNKIRSILATLLRNGTIG